MKGEKILHINKPSSYTAAGKPDTVYLEIGGVQFTVFSHTPCLLQKYEAVYRPFIKKKKNRTAAINVIIHLKVGNLPDTGHLTEIFDSGQSWSMFRESDGYWIIRQPRPFNTPLWAARFDRDMAEITVLCSDKITSTPFRYPLDQVLLMYILAENNGAIVHAAGIRIGDKGLLFPGPSGAGKSTLSRQFAGCKEAEVSLLSDDRIIIRKIGGKFQAFGTPWPGEEGIARNKAMPLSGILFLSHGERNSLKKLEQPEILEKLLRVTSIPWYDRDVMDNVLRFCEELIIKIPFYELHFSPDKETVSFLKNLSL
jgi:hypothetical protein